MSHVFVILQTLFETYSHSPIHDHNGATLQVTHKTVSMNDGIKYWMAFPFRGPVVYTNDACHQSVVILGNKLLMCLKSREFHRNIYYNSMSLKKKRREKAQCQSYIVGSVLKLNKSIINWEWKCAICTIKHHAEPTICVCRQISFH